MEKVANYRQMIQEVLTEYGEYLNNPQDEIEIQTIIDTVRDHYQLMLVGFRKKQRQFGCLFHADIKNGKIWIQHDSTDLGIGNEFLKRGVPKKDIVLGYYTPAMREYSDFAVT